MVDNGGLYVDSGIIVGVGMDGVWMMVDGRWPMVVGSG